MNNKRINGTLSNVNRIYSLNEVKRTKKITLTKRKTKTKKNRTRSRRDLQMKPE